MVLDNRQLGADMAFLLLLFMALVSYVFGRCALRVLYGSRQAQEMTHTDCFLTGGIIVIGLAGAAHVGAVFSGRSFSDCVIWFGGMTVALLFASAAVLWRDWHGKMKRKGTTIYAGRKRPEGPAAAAFAVFTLLALLQLVWVAAAGQVYRQGDMTVETVNSFLTENAIYQVNPMTGQAYEAGIPLRLKVLCLPTFYGILCRIFGLSAWQVVWTVMPAIVLLGAYCAYYGLSKRLFPASLFKRGVFMAAVALLFWVGDYMYGMDGFGLLHSGFRGTTVRAVILLP